MSGQLKVFDLYLVTGAIAHDPLPRDSVDFTYYLPDVLDNYVLFISLSQHVLFVLHLFMSSASLL